MFRSKGDTINMGEYKDSLFISYCWKDGNYYADELETQLKYYFDVRRDKSQLSANDDIYEFMSTIAACDNVVIVLTKFVNLVVSKS